MATQSLEKRRIPAIAQLNAELSVWRTQSSLQSKDG